MLEVCLGQNIFGSVVQFKHVISHHLRLKIAEKGLKIMNGHVTSSQSVQCSEYRVGGEQNFFFNSLGGVLLIWKETERFSFSDRS